MVKNIVSKIIWFVKNNIVTNLYYINNYNSYEKIFCTLSSISNNNDEYNFAWSSTHSIMHCGSYRRIYSDTSFYNNIKIIRIDIEINEESINLYHIHNNFTHFLLRKEVNTFDVKKSFLFLAKFKRAFINDSLNDDSNYYEHEYSYKYNDNLINCCLYENCDIIFDFYYKYNCFYNYKIQMRVQEYIKKINKNYKHVLILDLKV